MGTEYVRYLCKTCRAVSYTLAANVQTSGKKRSLRCSSGHRHIYDEAESENLQIGDDPEIRAKMGLS